jgi:hypothetical protein
LAEIDIDSNRCSLGSSPSTIVDGEELAMSRMDVLDPVNRHHVEQTAEALQREFDGVSARETIALRA